MHLTKHIKKEIKEFFEFSAVGVTSFLLLFLITLGLKELLGVAYQTAYGIGLASSYTYQFVLNMKLTFVAVDKPMLRMERFIVSAALTCLLNWACVVFIVEILGGNYIISILIINSLLGLFSFEMQELWVFKKLPRAGFYKHHNHLKIKARRTDNERYVEEKYNMIKNNLEEN
jgi:putative flippase GtrA